MTPDPPTRPSSEALLGPAGPVAGCLASGGQPFEERPQQTRMVEAVDRALQLSERTHQDAIVRFGTVSDLGTQPAATPTKHGEDVTTLPVRVA